jgi:hypothetical protein
MPTDVVSPESKIEILTVQFQLSKFKSIVVSSIYRPKFNLSYYDLQSLENVFNFLGTFNLKFYACGDFNIHVEDFNKLEIKRFNSLLKRLCLKEHVQKPTRGKARLDLIVSNDLCDLLSNVHTVPQTDHLATYVAVPVNKMHTSRRQITYRNYRSTDWEAFACDVVQETFSDNECYNTEQLCEQFINYHIRLFDKHAPFCTKSITQSRQPKILSESTRELKRLRNRLYKTHTQHPNPQSKRRLDITNKYLTHAIKHDTQTLIQSEINNKGLWHVKRKYCNKPHARIDIDPESMNEHFVSISNETITIPLPDKPVEIKTTTNFILTPISEGMLIKLYKKLNNRDKTIADITGLAPFMLKRTIRAPNVTAALLNLINSSLSSGDFPTSLKTSVVTPIPKITNPTRPIDYRPVSTQPFLSLLIEKFVHYQISNYMEDNNLFYKGQFGFRTGHSCERAMLALLDCAYKEINLGNICLLVSLDLAKAFDVIIREFLLEKLRWYGIDTKWYESYLSYRCQYVKGEKGNSSIKFTLRGCPQGSVQGSLIFNIYINDLPLVVRYCICILFADDTQLFISGKPNQLKSLIKKLEEDLRQIMLWMDKNGMKLNVTKTQLLVLGNSYNVSQMGQVEIDLDGTIIKSQDTLKSLGLTIDSKLTWYEHINKLSRSYHLAARSLYPLRYLLNNQQFLNIFNACVISKVKYMSILWGAANNSGRKVVERYMRKSARIILNKNWQDPIRSDMYKILKWLMPHDLYLFNLLCFVYENMHGINACSYFSDVFKVNHEIHNHDTRSTTKIYVPNSKPNIYGKRCISYAGAMKWNELPLEISCAPSLKTFKTLLKRHLLSSIQ